MIHFRNLSTISLETSAALEMEINEVQRMSIPDLILEFGSSDSAVGSWSQFSMNTKSSFFCLGEADVETLICQIQR